MKRIQKRRKCERSRYSVSSVGEVLGQTPTTLGPQAWKLGTDVVTRSLFKSWLFPRALGRHSILGHCTWSAVGRKLTLCPSASRPAAQNLPVGLLRQRHCFDQDSFLQHGVIISIYYLCFCPLTSSFSPKSS